MRTPRTDFLAEASLPVLKQALIAVPDKESALAAASLLDQMVDQVQQFVGKPGSSTAQKMLRALALAVRERALYSIDPQTRNGVDVIVYRGPNGSYVDADCTCFGNPGRMHSRSDCPAPKASE